MSSLMRRTRELAELAGIHPSRRLGQNFLVDPSTPARILDACAWTPGDRMLEIGPGLGALTFELAERGMPTVALDLDVRLLSLLRPRLDPSLIHLVAMDATCLDWRRLRANPPILVSNLPYPITSEILLSLCEFPIPVRRAVLMLQREVVERLIAPVGGSERGSLSVLVQLCFRVSRVLECPPEFFWPRPEVKSSVILLEPHLRERLLPRSLRRMLKAGFGQRRKTLSNSLGEHRVLLEKAGIAPTRRAQELTNEEWLHLSELADSL